MYTCICIVSMGTCCAAGMQDAKVPFRGPRLRCLGEQYVHIMMVHIMMIINAIIMVHIMYMYTYNVAVPGCDASAGGHCTYDQHV